jgi:hypothetical protein
MLYKHGRESMIVDDCDYYYYYNNNNNNNNEERVLIDVAISEDRNVIKKEAEKILKYKDITIEIQRMWNVKNKCDTSSNRGNCNHIKIIQKIPEQHHGKARNQGTAENSHIGHCTHKGKGFPLQA